MASLTHLLLAVASVVLVCLSIATDAYAYGTGSITYKQKPESPKSSVIKPNPSFQKPNVEHEHSLEKPKVDTVSNGHDTKPDIEEPNTGSTWQKLEPILEKTKPRVAELYNTIGIEGIVYCKSGAKLLPIQGATTRITCWAMDKTGYESHRYTTLSKTTDKKGYFLATLPISELQSKSKLFKCNAFLEKSPIGELQCAN